MKKIIAIIAVVAVFFAVDTALTYNNFIVNCDYCIKNDFEITQSKHPEKVWDKVFFGNSVVMSGYIEEMSSKDYVNLGLSYGVLTDLEQMIKKHHIKIGSELVIGLNGLVFYDEFRTNPTYIWHKKWYTPYAYFERDVFYPIISDGFNKLLHGEDWRPIKRPNQGKVLTQGMMTDEELAEEVQNNIEAYADLPNDKFAKNLDALKWVINYCYENNIRVRLIWMPLNPRSSYAEPLERVRLMVMPICDKYGVELLNLSDALGAECFSDTGHLNIETGAPAFTAIMDEWL